MCSSRLKTRAPAVKAMILLTCVIYVCIALLPLRKKPVIVRTHRFTVWTNDFHISPIHDIKDQLSIFDVEFIDKSLSGACSVTKSCAKNLSVIDERSGMQPNETLRQHFYNVYKDDPEMNRVNIFMCFHPAAMCELFMPFNRAMIVIATTRYDLGRFRKADFQRWNRNLQIIAANSRNVVAANNLYDAEYIRYFTGLRPLVLPSLCAYTNASYQPNMRKPVLLTAIHSKPFAREFTSNLSESLARSPIAVNVSNIVDVYKDRFEYHQLAEHPAIVYVPYQVSLMSLFEQYRMNIPLFVPSLDLLTEWHFKHHVVRERTWGGVFDLLTNSSIIPGVLPADVPDPNNEFDLHAIRYWLKFSDFYQWPHITYFHSIDDLVVKLNTTNLTAISDNMKEHNALLRADLRQKWRQILDRIN